MSEHTKKAPEQKFGDQVQETKNNLINSDYIIKSHELIQQGYKVSTSGNTQTGRVPKYSIQQRWGMVLNGFTEGERNNMCVSLSGYLLRINVDPNTAYAIVKKVNENSDVPLADKEVETIYRSAYQREKQRRLGGR